jgi:WD40 repeat protein
MSEQTKDLLASGAADPALVNLVDELADRLQAGDAVDWNAVAREYPEHVEQIRKLLPAIEAIAELGSATGRSVSRVHLGKAESGSTFRELGDYRIIGEVGRGGMGVVYEAIQISLSRRVALKVLPFAPALDSRQLQRFQNEARAAAHLNHTNIVPVYAVGCERGVHYYAMQFIEGQSLAALIVELREIEGRAHDRLERRNQAAFELASELASGRFAPVATAAALATTATEARSEVDPRLAPAGSSNPTSARSSTGSSTRTSAYFRTVARMGHQAAQALEHAHQQGVVHRDIKPSNLLVDVRGNLWVADFGLARFQSEAGLTMTGDLLGTLRYMSPEQALGKSGMADHRTDLYSLGATLYELLALEPVYGGRDRQEILKRIAFEEPRPPRRLNAAIPLDLETIVLKAMSKDPAARYGTAKELADDLNRFLECQPIRARRSNAWERSVKWAQRRPAIAALLTMVFLTSLIGFAGSTWQWLRAEHARQAETKTLYYNRIALAERELDVSNLRRVDQLLAECPPELRGWEWNYLTRARSGDKPMVLRAGMQVLDVAFCPDGQRLITAHPDGVAIIWNAATGEVVHRLSSPHETVRGAAFSPDGWRVASSSFDATTIWNALTGERIDTFRSSGSGWGVAFSPDGRLIASACLGKENEGRAVMVWDAKTHELIRTVYRENGLKLLTFSPDGTSIAATDDEDNVTIIDAKTGKVTRQLPGHSGGSHWPAYSPDGRFLAVACGDIIAENQGSIKIWDVTAGRLLHTLEGHNKVVWGVAFSPDGRRLASAGFDHNIKLWDPVTGLEALTLHGHTDNAIAVAFSPDGQRLASASEDGTIRIWNASPVTEAPARELLTLEGHTDEVRAVTYSPDGRWIASAGDDAIIRLWDAQSGRAVRLLRGPTHPVRGVAFSPDGKRLASTEYEETTRVWDPESGSVVREMGEDGDFGGGMAVTYSPDGLSLAIASGDGGEVWDPKTGKHLKSYQDHVWILYCLAFSHDGKLIATGSRNGAVKVSEASSARLIRSFNENTGRTSAVAFSPDDRRLAAASADGAVRIWDTTSWGTLETIHAHSGAAVGLAYSPDGQRIASGGADQTIKIWDSTSHREVLSLRGHRGEINAVAFSPDGKRLASASADHTVKIWDVTPGPDGKP